MECIKIGFVGGGNMAFAIANGVVSSKLVKADQLYVSAKTEKRLKTVWKELGANTTTINTNVVQQSDIVFLAVKPHILPEVLGEISQASKDQDFSKKIFVSIAAGITIKFMEERLFPKVKVIRTMPNTPCLIQSGMVVYCRGADCAEKDSVIAKKILEATGGVEEVNEKNIDAISAVMGCSIAWFQLVLEAISDGAVMEGAPRVLSYTLAAKAMEGAAKMLLETGNTPGMLKDQVTSPSGSTIRGLYELEQAGVRGSFMKAVHAATQRNIELGEQK